MEEQTTTEFAPPYISFAQLQNVLDRMRNEGMPARVDRSYLGSWSGSAQGQFLKAARSLDLIDEHGRPTDRLKALVDEPDKRPDLIAEIIREKYPEALALGKGATQQQLDEVFREHYGISGSTTRKAITFFLHAAKFAGIELSPFFKASRTSSGTTRSATRSRKRSTTSSDGTPPPPPPPDGGRGNLHPAIRAMVDALPSVGVGEPKPRFPEHEREAWIQYARATFNLIYASDDEEAEDDL